MTDGQTDGLADGGDCNIPDFLKKRGDKHEPPVSFKPRKKSILVSS